jgi:hypothetical protein
MITEPSADRGPLSRFLETCHSEFVFGVGGFNFEVQQNIVAPLPHQGRDVYSLLSFFFHPALRRSATAFACGANLPLPDSAS